MLPEPLLWAVFALAAIQSGLFALQRPSLDALVPRLVTALSSGLPRDAEIRAPADVVLDEEHGLILHPSLAVMLPPHGRKLRPDGSIWAHRT